MERRPELSVIQPYDAAGNIFRWNEPAGRVQTMHGFTWAPSSITFQSTDRATGLVLQSWSYKGSDNPVPGGENARLNLWLFQGAAPGNRQGVEIIVNKFEFVPGR